MHIKVQTWDRNIGENGKFMPKLGVDEKVHTSTFTTCQNIPSLIKNLKFMSELRVDRKIHTPTFIACQNIL